MTREEIITEYKRIREISGASLSLRQFLDQSKITSRMLGIIFGRNAFSKLVEICGDTPNKFLKEKSSLGDILSKYGKLVRKLGRLPAKIEWDNAKLRPTANGLLISHKLNWGMMPNKFLQFAQGKEDWADVVALVPISQKVENIQKGLNEKCFVYLMVDSRTGYYKIGISRIAEFREKTLQSEKPSISLITAKGFVNRRMAASFEKALHETYSHKRKRGEWFLLDEGDVDELKETLID